MSAQAHICIIDDDQHVRQSLRMLLEAAAFAVRDYASAHDFLADDVFGAACVVTDLVMPGMDGFDLQREISRRRHDLPLVMMSGHGRVDVAVRAMKAGAVDFLEKPFDTDALIASIRRAIAIGERVRSEIAETKVARRRLDLLTPREKNVLNEIVAGRSNKAAAERLGISPRTVEVYRAQIMDKLGAESLSDLVRAVIAARRTIPNS